MNAPMNAIPNDHTIMNNCPKLSDSWKYAMLCACMHRVKIAAIGVTTLIVLIDAMSHGTISRQRSFHIECGEFSLHNAL
jgi:hypothetical protein